MACRIIRNEKGEPFGVYVNPEFEKNTKVQVFSAVLNRLIRNGLANNIIIDSNKFEQKLLEQSESTKLLRTSKGRVFGMTDSESNIYLDIEGLLDETNLTGKSLINTSIHEFGHLWLDWASLNNKEVYNKGIELIENTDYLKQVQENPLYSNLTNQQRKEEALVTAIGDKGSLIVESSKKSKFREWLSSLWTFIKESMGISEYTSTQLEDVTLEQFAELVVIELLKGEEIIPFLRKDEFAIGQWNTEKLARERFDISKLKVLSKGGSDRVVFELGNNKVLKVAVSPRGLEQNTYEGSYALAQESLVPKLYEEGLNYVVVERVTRAKNSDVIPTYDIETQDEIGEETMGSMVKELSFINKRNVNSDKTQNTLKKYGLNSFRDYNVLWADFEAIRNWGIKDGMPIHLDGGTLGGSAMINRYQGTKPLEDVEFREIYYASKTLKKKFADKDSFTKFQAEFSDSKSLLSYIKNMYRYQEKINKYFPDNFTNLIENNSILFSNLAQLPVLTQEQALQVYKNILSEDFINKFTNISSNPYFVYNTNEPRLYYYVNGNAYTEYESALKNADGNRIAIGFIATESFKLAETENQYLSSLEDVVFYEGKVRITNKDSFITLATTSSKAGKNSIDEFINYSILRGTLSPNRKLVDGEYLLKGKGEFDSTSKYNSQIVRWEAVSNLGVSSIETFDDGTLRFIPKNTEVELETSDGKTTTISEKELFRVLDSSEAKSFLDKVKNKVSIVYTHVVNKFNLFGVNEVNNPTKNLSEEEVRMKLLNIIQSLGIKVTSLSDYLESYSTRHSKDIDVEALADLSNQIIALAQGKDTIENISEELGHFIIEAYSNQDIISEISLEVENTKEWVEHSERYYEKYGELYKGQELDSIVRKEVLGKILAKKILDGFTDTNNISLTSKLKTLFETFVAKIKSYFNPSQVQTLEDTLNSIAEKVVNNEIATLYSNELLESVDYKMFSLTAKQAIVPIVKAKRKLQKQLSDLRKSKDTAQVAVSTALDKLNKFDVNNVTDMTNQINDLDIWQGVVATTAVVDSQVKSLLAKAKENKSGAKAKSNKYKLTFSPAEQLIVKNLKNDYLEILRGFKQTIFEDTNVLTEVDQKNKNSVSNQIDNLVLEIEQLVGDLETINRNDFERISKDIQDMYGLTQEEQQNLSYLIEQDLTDISWMQSTFGSLEHASNPFLGMLGKIININSTNSRLKYLTDIKDFRRKLESENWKLSDWKRIIKTVSNDLTSYFKSPYDFNGFDNKEREAMKDAYNQFIIREESKFLTIEQYNKLRKDNKLKKTSDFTDTENIEYRLYMDKWYDENTEKKYTKEFYEAKRSLYEDNNIHRDTIDFLNQLSMQRAIILSKYRELGVIDYSKISDRDLKELQEITRRRKERKSVIDANTGEFKTGQGLVVAENLQFLDEYYLSQRDDSNAPLQVKSEFINELSRIENEADNLVEGRKAAYNWLVANGGITFSQEFWDRITSREGLSFIEKLEKLREDAISMDATQDVPVIDELSIEISELLEKKKQILKQHISANNPAEIEYEIMTLTSKDNIKIFEEKLEVLFRKANTLFDRYDFETIEVLKISENTVNEAYYKALKESNLGEIEFIKTHLTTDKNRQLNEVIKGLEIISNGSARMRPSVRRFLTELIGEDILDDEVVINYVNEQGVDVLSVMYGRTKLLPYFKRYAPVGYSQKINSLKNGNESVVNFYNKLRNESDTRSDLETQLEIRPLYSWLEDSISNEMVNPYYNEEFEGGRRQPKLFNEDGSAKFLDQEFFDYYGISVQGFKDNISQSNFQLPNATNNLEDYDMYNMALNYKRKAFEAMDMSDGNVYMLPQYSKSNIEKGIQFLTKNPLVAAKNAINDVFFNRNDELLHGEQLNNQDISDSSNIRLIPRYGIRKLEEKSDVSNDIGESLQRFVKDAYDFEQRTKTISDVNTIRQKMVDKKNIGNKDVINSNSITMFDEFVDFAFYGMKLNKKLELELPGGKKVDISKLAMVFDRFVRYMNLGFNVPAAITSLTTGAIFLRIESIIGEHINNNSSNWATKEHARLTLPFLKEVGKVDKNNRMFILGELFGVFDTKENSNLAGFNRVLRVTDNLPFSVHTLANFPVTPKIMLSVLDDFRLVNGKFITYEQFKKTEEGNLDKKESIEVWNRYREKSFYNYLQRNENGVIDFTEELKSELDSDYLQRQLSRVQGKIQSSIANIDSIVPHDDKSFATRHFLLTYTTAHRGWFSIALQRRFKKHQFNFQTGMFEEGHFRSFSRLLGNLMKNTAEADLKNTLDYINNNWDLLDDVQKRNVKRIAVESSSYVSMLLLGLLVVMFADDDENKDLWALQMCAYIYFRTTNEVASTQVIGLKEDVLDIATEPFMAVRNFKEIISTKGYSFEEVGSGTFKGYSKMYRKFAKQTYLRHFHDLSNIKQKSDFYRLMNADKLMTMQKPKKEE